MLFGGVIPSLHVDCKKSRIKRYHNEGQALRTEATINDTRAAIEGLADFVADAKIAP